MIENFDQRYQREAAEADACLARCAERRRLEQQPEPEVESRDAHGQQTIEQPQRIDAAWVVRLLNDFAGVIGAEVGKTQTEIVRKLREEIAALRAEIEILHRHKANKPDVNLAGVVPLRGRDVA